MDVKEAIRAAKTYLGTVYAEEGISNLELEETEHDQAQGRWIVTVAFSRPWTTPRSRAQEVLEQLGAVTGSRRAFKTVTVSEAGEVLSMKNYTRPETVG